jgi:hypothetical protein
VRSLDSEVLASHPFRLLHLLRQRYGPEVYLEFSKYSYQARSLRDERQIFQVPAWNFHEQQLVDLLNSLPQGYELALHSKVYVSPNSFMHLPMIDCSTKKIESLTQIARFLPPDIVESFYWYNSGRSFHGYGMQLLDHAAWVDFMGRLLLVNTPGHQPVVDPRWIGHRLMAGYSALRWSWNSSQYLHPPRFVLTWVEPLSSQPGSKT